MQPQRPPSQAREGSSGKPSYGVLNSRQKPSSLANVAVQSFAAFRAQTSSIPVPSPVRRKPLPANASPIASRFSSAEYSGSPKLVGDRGFIQRSYSIDSPPPQELPRLEPILSPPLSATQEDFVPRDLDRYPHERTALRSNVPDDSLQPRIDPYIRPSYNTSQLSTQSLQRPRHDRATSSYYTARQSTLEVEESSASKATHIRSPTMPNMSSYNTAARQPSLTLQLDGVTGNFLDDEYSPSPDSQLASRQPKSPGARLTSFFSWRTSSQQNGADSPTTTFSERSLSPAHSPMFPKHSLDGSPQAARSTSDALDIPMANSIAQPSYFNVPGTPLLSSSPTINAHVEELERELREVSSELASSIRREMELEDEMERWKSESNTLVSEGNRRTSDYYSDSGASSVRFPVGDSETKLEDVERLRRKAEQERAQLKVDMAQRIQEELRRRRDLEAQVRALEEHMHNQGSMGIPSDSSGRRVRELEGSLEDARRRLAEERQVKENFEDLLTALRQDLEQHRNERDNLRDEIVPQLRARVEGLEAEAAEVQTLIYESTRMQQEIQSLRNENQTLVNARRTQLELAQQQQPRFKSIAEEVEPPSPVASPRVGLTRSNSLARSSAFNSKRGSLSRSNSVKDRGAESPRDPSFQDRVKDIEEQRDALHCALKSLLHRQEYQAKEYEKRIRTLEVERDNALNLTPRRTAFHSEVSHLREEVNHLRRRADEALEQKWQCEKGLSGLRMDLDRAEQETSSLRELLQEHDIFLPERKGSVVEIRIEDTSAPVSLDKAYKELRTTYALSLAQIKEMESEDSLGAAGAEAERIMALLKQSISDAEAERDIAQKEAVEYREKARALQKSEIEHLGKEQSLSAELYASATRMDELAAKVQQQLQSNKTLRQRLADAIARGEKEQEKSAGQIVELERKLKAAEDRVMSAQQSSEEAVFKHEEEVRFLKESHNNQLRRTKSGLLTPTAPLSPLFAVRSPRLDNTTSGPGMTMAEATRTEMLEKRVEDLEKALSEADREMEEVVSRMNFAQIEVAELQTERDEAMRQTRKLQADIIAEREKVKALMS